MEMVIATQNTMVSMNGMTVKRTQVIAERTGDVMMGAIKAQMIETLKAKLNNGIAHFIFVKKSGELREMWATTMSNIASAKTNGRGCSRENYCTTAVFDVEKGAWRSFRWESIVKVF